MGNMPHAWQILVVIGIGKPLDFRNLVVCGAIAHPRREAGAVALPVEVKSFNSGMLQKTIDLVVVAQEGTDSASVSTRNALNSGSADRSVQPCHGLEPVRMELSP